jgi:enoyl-CoA hydratase/carnithine racemase
MGLAAVADFRIAGQAAYFSANFVKVGIHHGFGLSLTLPAIVGKQQARRILYLGDRVSAATAAAIGLADVVLGPSQDLLSEGRRFAAHLADVPPAALAAVRRTCRKGLSEARFRAAVAHESAEQSRLRSDKSGGGR